MQQQSIKRVVIRAPNWVGDAVMAVPALGELRRIFSAARVTLVARAWVAGLLEDEGLFDDLIPVTDARGLKRVAAFLADARRLRAERADLAVLLQNAFGAALAAKAGGARRVTGYPTDGRRALLDYSIAFEHDYKTKHQARYYLNIAAELERRLTGTSLVEIESARPRLHAREELKHNARAMLEGHGVAQSSRIVVINPGATNSRAKQWLPERFAEAADLLAARDGFQAVIAGTVADVEAAARVARLMRAPVAMLAGQTSISELKGVLACSSLVISNDTGTAHVSAALGVPTVVIFGPTEHVATRPLSDVATVVRHPVDCSPCMLRECPIDHRCMTRVEVGDVYAAARALLVSASGK
jgi:heptosyltransferase-2